MSVIINGTTGITSPGGDVSAVDNTVSGLTVGKGGGAVASNTAVGLSAIGSSNTGGYNAAFGSYALGSNTSGIGNTALGNYALTANTTGQDNTAIGGYDGSNLPPLRFNTTGSYNVAVGVSALTNSNANYNTAVGTFAMNQNTSGTYNSAYGENALTANTSGAYNVALGGESLRFNTTASYNTAVGYQAGYTQTTGTNNCLIGAGAGYALTTGSYNTFVGPANAGFTTASGSAITTGSKNTIIGGYIGNQGGLDIRTSSNYIVLSDGDGNPRAFVNASGYFKATNAISGGLNSITGTYAEFGQTANDNALYVASYNTGQTNNGIIYVSNRNTTNNTFNAIAYYNNAAGSYRFYVADSGSCFNTFNNYGGISDIKLKENIVDATPKLEDLCKVKVRQYNLKSEPDRKQIGVIAQELEEVFAGLVEESADKDGEGNDLGTTTKTVKYSVFVPMLIKAIQELKAEFDAYKATHP